MTFTGDFTGTRTLDITPEAIVEGSTFAERYAIEERLGAGAQATVYSALDMLASPPRRVALKIGRSEETKLSREAEFLARVHRDGDIAGVVRLVEPSVQEFGGVNYLVLEHIDGPTLRNVNWPMAEVCRLGLSLARTLASIHAMNIVLADVKPENILLRAGIEPVIVDFGAARELHDSAAPRLLTPAYAAPEQHAGEAPTCASDVYALALVLGELAGARPPKKLVSILSRAKARDPAERPSALELSQLLEVAQVSLSKKQFRSSFWGRMALGILGAGLFVSMGKWSTKPEPESSRSVPKPALTMISARGMVFYVALGKTHLYWDDGDGRTVYRAPLAGGPVETLTQLDGPAHQLALSGQTLFIRSPDTIWAFADGKLERFAESTGSGGITADDRQVVWTHEQKGDVVVASVRKDAPLRVIVSGQARPYSVTMDAKHVYWANEENGTLARAAREGGDVEVLARKQSWPVGTALDETHLYWLDRAAGHVMRIPKEGGAPQILTNTSVGSFSAALSGTHLYWTSPENGRVMRVLKTGGIAEPVAEGQLYPFAIFAHENEVFFSMRHHLGGVMRLVVP